MYGRMQEDVAWSRLLDMQREAENRRLGRGIGLPTTVQLTQFIRELITRMARLAVRRGSSAVRDVA